MRRRARSSRGLASQSGVVVIETLGIFVLVLTLTLVLVQGVVWGYTFTVATHAAREGAHELALGGDGTAAAVEELPSGWRDRAVVEVGSNEIRVEVRVPVALLGVSLSASATQGFVPEPGVEVAP